MLGQAIKHAGKDFIDDGAMTLAAAVAFYAALSFAPMIMLVMSIGGIVGQDTRDSVIDFFEGQAGPKAAQATDAVVKQAQQEQKSAGSWRWFVSIGVLLFSASTVFAQLQAALNRIWGVEAAPGGGAWQWLRKRLVSMSMIFAILAILIVALIASSMIQQLIPTGNPIVARIVSLVTSIGIFTLLFAMTFKVLPDVRIDWRNVWMGALITAVLFAAGMLLISLYMQYGGVAKGFSQAAAGLIALLVWAYYSGIVFFFGAEVTQHYARLQGSAIEPDRHARRIEYDTEGQARDYGRRRPRPA